jgi:hypothetical protein
LRHVGKGEATLTKLCDGSTSRSGLRRVADDLPSSERFYNQLREAILLNDLRTARAHMARPHEARNLVASMS